MFKLGTAVLALLISTAAIQAHAQGCGTTGSDPVPTCRTTTNAPAAPGKPAKHIIRKAHR